MTAWTDVIGWTLLHFVWEGTLIALLTALGLAAFRRASAHVRYVVACAGLSIALAAVALTPLALMGIGSQLSPAAVGVAELPRRVFVQADRAIHSTSPVPVATAGVPLDEHGLEIALTAFVAFWAAGVLLLTARLGVGWWRVRRLHAEALLAPASAWLVAAMRIAGTLGLPRRIHVVDSDGVETPSVIGWLRPVVLLPIAALAALTPGQVEAILAHELAHVRRHDFIVNLLQTVAETVLFYHPAVWWLSSRIRTEREHCCDDIAVELCGDPVGYAEALTAIASWTRLRNDAARQPSPSLAVAATGGSLLHRVRRLLHVPVDAERRRPKAPFVLAATVLLIVIVGARLLVVAQAPPPLDDPGFDRHLGPVHVNRILGYNLFPGPVHYVGDDPRGAKAWDVKVAYPNGEMAFMGFTARSVIRYAYDLDGVPVMDGPAWLDTESLELHAETSADQPTDADFREAVRVALEGQYRMSIRRESRLFPVLGLQPVSPSSLGPNIQPSTSDCLRGGERPVILGPTLHARGERTLVCGIDNTIRGPRGYRVTLAQFARSLRGFNLTAGRDDEPAREVVDQTGLTGVYDFELNLGFLPLAVVATAHPAMASGFGPMIPTFPQAIEDQLGLKLVPSDTSRDVIVIATAQRALQRKAASVEPQLAESPKTREEHP